jgi:hypothetical protein
MRLPEFDKEYLESSKRGRFSGDYVGAFFTGLLPDLRQKLEKAREEAPIQEYTDSTGVRQSWRMPTQETVAYERTVCYLETYLAEAKVIPLDVHESAYKEMFPHQHLERFPEHKQWEAALVYMIMCLSNDIHTVITSIRGNNFAFGGLAAHTPWSEESKTKVLNDLEHRLELVNNIIDDISENYFPFTCG